MTEKINYPWTENDDKEVLIHINLGYMFDSSEMCFLIHLIHLDALRSEGKKTAYSLDFMYKKFRLNMRKFQRCSKKMSDLNLLIKKKKGIYNDYILNRKLFVRLLEIVCCTTDVFALIDFCDREFKIKNRTIESITDSEINILKSISTYNLLKNDKLKK